MNAPTLLIRNAEVNGQPGCDIEISGAHISRLGQGLKSNSPTIDAAGGAVIPGLHDHHIHLFSLAAAHNSLRVGPNDVADAKGFENALRGAKPAKGAAGWLRAIGYHERVAGPLTREVLDQIISDRPVRVQYATGSLWVLNSKGLALILDESKQPPACVERDADGVPTGRIWRGDRWLREQLKSAPPDLEELGRLLASYGVTGVTDATVTTGEDAAAYFAQAVRAGKMLQRLHLMSGSYLDPPEDGAFSVGPVKIVLDEARLPGLADVILSIRNARVWKRCVAVHCVTTVELAFALAAFLEAGSIPGDRIEHGGIIGPDAISELQRLGLSVITQSAIIAERGDTYLREVDKADLDNLYRCGSLIAAGIPVGGSSDAPFTNPDPWAAIAAAVNRRTLQGDALGMAEAITPRKALDLYLGTAKMPGGPPRQVAPGARADLCILRAPLSQILRQPKAAHVAQTIIAGKCVAAN